jgi:hypothetical protein
MGVAQNNLFFGFDFLSEGRCTNYSSPLFCKDTISHTHLAIVAHTNTQTRMPVWGRFVRLGVCVPSDLVSDCFSVFCCLYLTGLLTEGSALSKGSTSSRWGRAGFEGGSRAPVSLTGLSVLLVGSGWGGGEEGGVSCVRQVYDASNYKGAGITLALGLPDCFLKIYLLVPDLSGPTFGFMARYFPACSRFLFFGLPRWVVCAGGFSLIFIILQEGSSSSLSGRFTCSKGGVGVRGGNCNH